MNWAETPSPEKQFNRTPNKSNNENLFAKKSNQMIDDSFADKLPAAGHASPYNENFMQDDIYAKTIDGDNTP